MKNYIIWAPPFSPQSGGITVLHKLCHLLNKHGQNAFIWPGNNNFDIFFTNGKYNTPLAKMEMLIDAIVVYPEIVIDNPLHANHVVRWILNVPGVMGGDGVFGKNDMLFYYSNAFTEGRSEENFLKIFELYGDLFRNYNQERSGNCFVRRKGKDREIVHELIDSVEIVNSTPSPALVNLFNKKKYFYSYDGESFLSIQAAMCGCISIIVPFENISAEEWLSMDPTRKYGIAYGVENIDHAIKTMHKVKPYLEFSENHSILQLKNFIEKTQEMANSKKNINMAESFNIHDKMKIGDKVSLPKVSIIIPLFNQVEYTKQCLEALIQNTPDELYEVIVVDNASTDGTKEFSKSLEGDVKIITNDENLGFAKACNQGAKAASYDYLLFLNNDTEVRPGWLEPLVCVVDNDLTVAAVGSKMLFPDRTIQHAGVIVFDDQKLPDRLVARHIYYGKNEFFTEANVLREYQVLTAACLLVRKNVYEKAGGFDEKYWNGYEDVDLCFNIQKMGKKLVYQPQSIVIHHESKSGAERFSKVNQNIELLHSKWLGKIKPDFVITPEGKVHSTNANKIKPYRLIVSKKISAKDAVNLVSIIILTYNQLEYTKKCLESIAANTPEAHELILVDNGSTDGTVEYLESEAERRRTEDGGRRTGGRKRKTGGQRSEAEDRIKIIKNKENLGFALGNNQGIAEAKGDYVVLMNNDLVVTPGWLKRLIASAKRKPQIGIVGPMSNYVSGPQLVKEVSYDETSLAGLNKFSQTFSKKHAGQTMPFWRVVGFCMLIKRAVIEKIGGLDGRFGLGNFEDDDFSLRAALAGFESWIVKDCFVHHFGSRTFAGARIDFRESLHTNWEIFKQKWGIPADVAYGAPYNMATVVRDGFIPEKHYCPLTTGEYTSRKISEKIVDTDAAKKMYQNAQMLIDNGMNNAAIMALGKLLESYPNFALAHNDLGVLYYKNDKKEDALEHYQKAAELQPDNINFQKNLADFYYVELGRVKDAMEIYVKILALNPRDIECLLMLGHISVSMEKFDDAKVFYIKVLEVDPDNIDARQNLDTLQKYEQDAAM